MEPGAGAPGPVLPAVCFFQAYNRDYIRSEALLAGLDAHGVPLVRCQVNRRGPARYPLALLRFLRAIGRCDVVVANFRSFELLWLLRRLTRKPILYDAHISFWQSACEERRWFGPRSPAGRALFLLDRLNCRLADHVLLDTEAHRSYFVTTFGVPREKISVVYISCDDRMFFPRPDLETVSCGVPAAGGRRPRRVLWSGSGIPLQGLEVVYEAFRDLGTRGVAVELRIAGTGAIIRRLARRAAREGVGNIVFLGRLSRREVAAEVALADIGLGGHYSTVPKASQVIAGKVYELIAMRKPVVIGDSPAVRELFEHGRDAVLCEMGSPAALADAVALLAGDPVLARRIAAAGYELYLSRLAPAVNVAPLLPVLGELASRPGASRGRSQARRR